MVAGSAANRFRLPSYPTPLCRPTSSIFVHFLSVLAIAPEFTQKQDRGDCNAFFYIISFFGVISNLSCPDHDPFAPKLQDGIGRFYC